MEKSKTITTRRVKLDKTQSTIFAVIGISSFIVIFSIIISKALISQIAYQNIVENTQTKSLNLFRNDIQAAASLVSSYKAFIAPSTNIIGGPTAGTTNNSGTNSKIILDALPDTYDYPALVTSIQDMISLPGVTVQSLGGTDTGTGTNSAALDNGSLTAVPVIGDTSAVPMPFEFNILASYTEDQQVIDNLQASIRPIQIESISFSGTDNNLVMVVDAQSFYQPAIGLITSTELIK